MNASKMPLPEIVRRLNAALAPLEGQLFVTDDEPEPHGHWTPRMMRELLAKTLAELADEGADAKALALAKQEVERRIDEMVGAMLARNESQEVR